MKKTYETPELHVHGSVMDLTSASSDSDRQDRIFNADGVHSDSGTGSLDQCFFDPGTSNCIIAE